MFGCLRAEFLETILDCYMEQLLLEPTRFREGQNPSLLDLLIVNNPDIVSGIWYEDPLGKCDHVVVCFKVNNKASKIKRNKDILNFRKIELEKFNQIMQSYEWESLLREPDIEKVYDEFVSTVQKAIISTVPIRSVYDRSKTPWITKRLKNLSQKKKSFWNKYQYTNKIEDYERYTLVLNVFTAEKMKAMLDYENNVIAQKNSDRKQYYNYVSRKKKYSNNKISLIVNGELAEDDEKCANALNDFFSSVFTKGPSQLPPTQNSQFESMEDVDITVENVKKKLDDIDCSKSCGPDNIPGSVLKNSSHIFAPILCQIFRRSYEMGVVPKMMKMVNVVPLFKTGDRN